MANTFPIDEFVDLDGHVVPGFNDAHAHPTMAAENLLHLDCSPEVTPDKDGLARRLRTHARTLGDRDWVRGARYDEAKTTGGQVIDRWFLDAVVPDRPTLVTHVSAHWGVLNSAGLSAAGLSDASPDPRGGALGRDAVGHLNGVVFEQALFDLAYPSLARDTSPLPASSDVARRNALGRALRMFHAAGLTSMTDALCGPEDIRLLLGARATGALSMRVSVLVPHTHYRSVRNLGLTGPFGDSFLRVLGVKAFVDGACAGGTCLVDEPYDGTHSHGLQTIEAPALEELVSTVAGDGVVLGTHANGDRAIRMLLDAHEKARRAGAPIRRHRIEHCSLIDADIIQRMRALGMVAVPFGAYARYHGDRLQDYFGTGRLERMFAHRTFLEEGIPVAGSSDYPCGPFEPLLGIASCVQRRSLGGSPVGPSQRIGVADAVRLYTHGSAYASGEEQLKGDLLPGKFADFVELDQDLLEVATEDIQDVGVHSTWVGGRPVFEAAR